MVDVTAPKIPIHRTDVLYGMHFSVFWYTFFDAVARYLEFIRPVAVAQADLASLAANRLKAADAGRLVYVSDFNHVLEWSGTEWAFGPGDASDYYVDGFADPPAPTGWHLADASTVSYLKSDGTLGSRTLSNTANRWFRI